MGHGLSKPYSHCQRVETYSQEISKTVGLSKSPNFFQDQLRNVIALSASYGAFAALRSDGRVVTWGDVSWRSRRWRVKHGETTKKMFFFKNKQQLFYCQRKLSFTIPTGTFTPTWRFLGAESGAKTIGHFKRGLLFSDDRRNWGHRQKNRKLGCISRSGDLLEIYEEHPKSPRFMGDKTIPSHGRLPMALRQFPSFVTRNISQNQTGQRAEEQGKGWNSWKEQCFLMKQVLGRSRLRLSNQIMV